MNNENKETVYYDPTEDKINKRTINDTRKTVITLKKINKLKKIREMKKLSQLKRQDLLGIMYGSSGDQSGGMGF